MAKKYSRRLQSVAGGKLLKMFDEKTIQQEVGESEGIREAIKMWVGYNSDNGAKRVKKNS